MKNMDLSDIRAKISELEQRQNQVQCSLNSTFFQGAGNVPLSPLSSTDLPWWVEVHNVVIEEEILNYPPI
ncbi:unnamed protein product [Paramecium pentaurelia]|uniref:Uncharacterized protein n=1 Tax=Paramecium pentaurelia TaxID=43138 RepID=A0A8S1XBS3_9CILI|nr:unnamed protein product [Paramecium pentaurelia]